MNTGETIALIKALGGGGSSLPSVSSSDNGKVLAVVGDEWAATKSVYIIESSGNTSPLNGSEISTLAQSGILPVLYYSNSYWIYSMNNGSTAYFVKYLYSPYLQKYNVRYAFVNSSKNINAGLSQDVYILPSTGIPETDLAQDVKDKLNKFVVTLTPTAPDYSGTMDKTPQEITEAYEAGQDIEFDIPSLEVKCKAMEFAVNDGIIQAGAIVTYRTGGSHMLIEVLTHSTASEYFTSVYSLTPAS